MSLAHTTYLLGGGERGPHIKDKQRRHGKNEYGYTTEFIRSQGKKASYLTGFSG
jgi:hypothetical protein